MDETISIAIETTCRHGGAALGRGGNLARVLPFDASARHATQLLTRLDELLKAEGLGPRDVREVYVSVGPGSFTGCRVGVIVARTLAQAIPSLRCVAVPTPWAVAHNALSRPWEHLGVILDAKEDCVHASLFGREGGRIVPSGPAAVVSPAEFLAAAPRPLLLIGEGLGYHELHSRDVTIGDASLHFPQAEGVWHVGRAMAAHGEFTEYHHLLPAYVRKPEAVRLWERRFGAQP